MRLLILAALLLAGARGQQPEEGAPAAEAPSAEAEAPPPLVAPPSVGAGVAVRCAGPGCAGKGALPPRAARFVPGPRDGPAASGPIPLLRPSQGAPAQEPAADGRQAQDDASGPGKLRVRGLDGRVRERDLSPAQGDLLRKRKEFELALLKDDGVRKAYDDWASLDDSQRREALARVTEIHSRVYGVPAPKLAFGPLPGGADGMYKDDGTIIINDQAKSWDDPDKAFGVAAHENAHHYQRSLIDGLQDGRLQPAGELAALAQEWKRSQDGYCAPVASGKKRRCGYAEYRDQPVEADAFAQGEDATKYLRSPAARGAFAAQAAVPAGRR